ncbi:MAG: hypothetical protein RIS44_1731 [Pseudomonadota bacterium]|jgi:DNA-binding MarR family transcriptional regulator
MALTETSPSDRDDAATKLHPDACARVLRQFRVVFNAVKTHFRQVEKSAGIGGAQLWALSIIANQPGLGVGELAVAMDIHQSTASNLVRTLLDRQLVLASKESQDRRSVRLKIGPIGQDFLAVAPQPFTGVLPLALAQLDPSTLMRLEQDLTALVNALDADLAAAKTPLSHM